MSTSLLHYCDSFTKSIFGFKHLYISVIFFGVRIFRRLVFSRPLIVSLLLLVGGGFLGCCFPGGLLLGLLLWFVGLAQSTVSLLLQRVDLSTHSDYRLLLFSCSSVGLPQAFSSDRIPSTTPGAEPPRDARDSGSARSHSTHLETSPSDRPKMVTYAETQTVPSYMSVTYTRRTLRMLNFTRATHAQPSLSNLPWRDSDFGKRTSSRGTTLGEQNFPTSPQNKITKFTHCSIYTSIRTISSPHTK